MACLRTINGLGVGYMAWKLLTPSPVLYLRNDETVDGLSPKKATLLLVNAGRGPMYITKMELKQRDKNTRWQDLYLMGAPQKYTVRPNSDDLLSIRPWRPRLVTEASEIPLVTFHSVYEDEDDGVWPWVVGSNLMPSESRSELHITYKLAEAGLLSCLSMTKQLDLH